MDKQVSESKEIDRKGQMVRAVEDRPGLHPHALIFPEMQAEEFEQLVQSIRENGQREPVLLADGKVADGRHRARAVWRLQDEGLSIELKTVVWDPTTGRSLVEEVWQRNALRRHLKPDQLAMSAVRYRKALAEEARQRQEASRFGSRGKGASNNAVDQKADPPVNCLLTGDKNERSTRGRLAKMANVSRHKVALAIQLDDAGDDALKEDVRAGRMTLATACKRIRGKDSAEKEHVDRAEKPQLSVNEIARRAWINLKKQVGCAEAPALRMAMREVIDADERAHGGGKNNGTGAVPLAPKRGRGRPPKNPSVVVADLHGCEPMAAIPGIEVKEAIKCS